ncbi:Hemolysin-type calcium-binding protein [Pseudooceanicola batsensis HTCC2597]|uniref:Hemolysin-type calcium-binding protein n=1 Tax=Pseudooceanicola batsensis (strain ATCC BAA-863 / DSM 15984 / KCTC 12145 / HTCC2597) TaxID=252305 RepID=A3U0N2_PSEBH|nr:calcium-binding protein [Pseudooceanicola batsensis]EAQ02323.1 Hemolysin-type calcium-binding protein [Pseudooceanicola batsensis HTCC2597]
MGITRTGVFSEDSVDGFYRYGDGGTGTITIDGGSVLPVLASNTAAEPRVRVGVNGGDGEVTISGTGSAMTLDANGSASLRANIQVGRDSGSIGDFNLLAGAELTIQDTAGAANSPDSDHEGIDVGIDGGTGTFSADASTVTINGTGAALEIGRDGGTGTANFNNGSVLTLSSASGGADDFVGIALGADYGSGTAGTGTLNVDNSTINVLGTGGSEAYFHIGRDGTATATLTNNASFNVIGYNNLSAGGTIGRYSGSDGTFNVNSGSELVIRNDVGDSYMNIGRAGGTGALNIGVTGSAMITGVEGAALQLGRSDALSSGDIVNAGDLTVSSTNQYTYVSLGREGGTGTANNTGTMSVSSVNADVDFELGVDGGVGGLTNSGTLTVASTNAGARLTAGTGGVSGGTGDFTQTGGTTSITAATQARFQAGIEQAVGTALIQSGGLLQVNGTQRSQIIVGADFGTGPGMGTMEVTTGATIDQDTADDAFNDIGTGGNGVLRLNNATWQVDAGDEFNVNVGRQSGTGLLEFLNGSTAVMNATGFSGLSVGREAGSNGTLNITGSTMTVNSSGLETFFNLGRSGGIGNLNLDNGSLTFNAVAWSGANMGREGTANVSLTNGSLLEFNSGYGAYASFGRDGGSATVTVDNSTLRFSGTGSSASDPLYGDPMDSGFSIGRGAGGSTGTVSVANGGLLEVLDSGRSVYANVGNWQADSGTLNLTNATMNMAATGAAGAAYFNVGRDGSTGVLDVDGSTLNVSSASEYVTFRIGTDFGTGGANGSVSLANGSALNLAGMTALVSVGYDISTSASLEVLSGSTIGFTDGGGQLDGAPTGVSSAFAVGQGNRIDTATALIDGTGSSVSGMDAVVVGGDEIVNDELTGSGDGQLTITNGGALSAGIIAIGQGGTLVTGDASVTATGSGFGIAGGEWDILAGGVTSITGHFVAESGSINLLIDAATGQGGRIDFANGDVSFGAGMTVNIDVRNGFLTAGDSFRVVNFSNLGTLTDDATLNLLNQSAGFGFALLRNATTMDLVALNNGDGTGSADLDFGEFIDVAATFELNTDTNEGDGSGGTLGADLTAVNVDRVLGTSVADTFTATGSGAISLFGRTGDDTLTAGSGNDILDGGLGADSLLGGNGDDTIDGGSNPDVINGGAGDDWVTYESAASGARRISLGGSAGEGGASQGDVLINIENAIGSNFRDLFIGTGTANQLNGLQGDDTFFSGAGNDTIDGGSGDDVIDAGDGADSITGGAGIDTVRYASSAAVQINLAANIATGGQAEGDTFFGIENVVGSQNADTIIGDGQDNLIEGIGGDDHMRGGLGADTIIGYNGIDTASYQDSAVGVNVGIYRVGTGGTAEGDRLIYVERIIGSGHDDELVGGGTAPILEGAGGDDLLIDYGGAATIMGGNGDDTINAGTGADSIDGGAGIDTVRYANTSSVQIDLAAGTGSGFAAEGDTLVNVENVIGSNAGDTLTGDDQVNRLEGLYGEDTIKGGLGNDLLLGGGNADVFVFDAVGFGRDLILDWQDNYDKIDLRGSGLTHASFTEVDTAQGVRLDYFNGVSTDAIHLFGASLSPSDIDASDFLV